ncbi:hypothetical protein PFISCL1PPCAC_10150, partial [Pristionchus fissidentatus]
VALFPPFSLQGEVRFSTHFLGPIAHRPTHPSMAPTRIVLVPAGTVVPQRKVLIAAPPTRGVAPSTSFAPSTHHIKMDQSVRRVDPLELLNPTPIVKTRKRERLTALTAEEKLARRKMKNRVAAQTARDRKKERTNGLEDAVQDLVDENKRLREENSMLMERLARLEEESRERRRVKEEREERTTTQSFPPVTPLGSAVSINDLQQRAQAVTGVVGMTSNLSRSRLNLLPLVMLLLSYSTTSTSRQSSKTSGISTWTKWSPLSTNRSMEKRRGVTYSRLTKRRLIRMHRPPRPP